MDRKFLSRIGLTLCFLLILSLLIFKDRIALQSIRNILNKAMPGTVLNADKIVVWPSTLEVKEFDIKKAASKSSKGAQLSGGSAVIRFSLLGLLGDPLFALNEAHIKTKELRYEDLAAQDLLIELFRNRRSRYLDSVLDVKALNYGDVKVGELKARFKFSRDFIIFDEINSLALGGKVFGTGSMFFKEKLWILDLKAQLEGIDIVALLKAFGANKGIEASGVFSGDITVVLENGLIRDLKGELASAGGGQFIVTDTGLLDNNLKDMQGANIVVENLKNYHYDIGYVKIRNEGQDIRLDIVLQGQEGSRNLEVDWHRGEISNERQ